MNPLVHFAATAMLAAASLAHAQTAQGGVSTPAKASAPAVAMPLVDGEVRKVDTAKGEVVLKHGDLPNLAMPAMTMAFNVADPTMLGKLKVGDKVRFNAELVKGKPTITQMEAK